MRKSDTSCRLYELSADQVMSTFCDETDGS
jgi:hypothetical protein